MDPKDIPVVALAAEYRGEARSLRRGLGAALMGIVGFGVLYLVPYVALLGEEGELAGERGVLGEELASARGQLRSVEAGRELVGEYQLMLRVRSLELTEEAIAEVLSMNELLEQVAHPEEREELADSLEVPATAQMVAQSSVSNLPMAEDADPLEQLRERFGLTEQEVKALLNPRAAGREKWETVVNGALGQLMTTTKAKLRQEAREGAGQLALALGSLEPPLGGPGGGPGGADFAASVMVPVDAAPPVSATPLTTDGKGDIMAAEFEHIQVPAAEVEAQLGLRADDLVAAADRLDERSRALGLRVNEIAAQKAELEESMLKTAAQLEEFALPFGILEWNSARLTRWFPLLAGLCLLYFACASARLDRRRTAIAEHLADLPAHDRTLLCGARAQPLHTLAIAAAGLFVIWLQRVTGTAADGLLLWVVAATCVLAAATCARPLMAARRS